MMLHEIARKTKNKVSRQVGRGGRRGKTSGRGTKGQNARAGKKKRPELRDIIKKIPKLRGHGKNRANTVIANTVQPVVNLKDLNVFPAGTTVNAAVLVAEGLVRASHARKNRVKVLGTGTIDHAITLVSCDVSASAKEKILAAGGTVTE